MAAPRFGSAELRGAKLHHADAQTRPHPMQEGRRIPIRVGAYGECAAEFFFPLALLKPRDRLRKELAWQAKHDRDAVLRWMALQRSYGVFAHRDSLPLTGCRPLVRCIRYSSTEPDSTAGWGKVAVDCLQPGGLRRGRPYSGLGIIRSDSPRETDVVEWWEPAPRGKGFCVVEVWKGW